MKSAKQLEKHLKALSNHNRIKILLFIDANDGATVFNISKQIKCNFSNTSQHIQRLVAAGLLDKSNKGNNVKQSLSPYGREVVKFLHSFSKL